MEYKFGTLFDRLNPTGMVFPDTKEEYIEMIVKGIQLHIDAFKDQIQDGEEVNS